MGAEESRKRTTGCWRGEESAEGDFEKRRGKVSITFRGGRGRGGGLEGSGEFEAGRRGCDPVGGKT